MLSDIEIWRAANLLIRRHGADAEIEAANADADHGLSAADGSERQLRLATDIDYGGSGCGMALAATPAAAPSAVLALAFYALPTTTSLLARTTWWPAPITVSSVRELGPGKVRG